MPRVRIEWVPVQLYGLGHLGFDHLQLVFEPGDAGPGAQDNWFVMEGVREASREGIFLGIEGADGRMTLAAANLASRDDLTAKIGTPAQRGSRVLGYGGEEFGAWETMASYATDIEAEDYPYIAFGLPGSPVPTINSSSAIASLVHYSGLDPRQALPYGLHRSPGMSTLLGTSGADRMRIEHGFTTLLGGRGADWFAGGADADQIEKFYGGEGDDIFRWSPGFDIAHGGQPQLDYAADGTDVIDYSGAGEVTITFNRHWIPHKVPNYVATFATGVDHLFSIERIQWNAKTDHIVLGKDTDLLEDDRVLGPSAVLDRGDVRIAAIVGEDRATLGDASTGNDGDNRLLGTRTSDVIEAGGGDDTIYGGEGDDTLSGGAGSDAYVYLAGDGHDMIIEADRNSDIDELVLAGGLTPADVEVLRLGERDLLLAVPGGSILISGFFSQVGGAGGPGIERVVFDHAPAWTRKDIEQRAAEEPPLALLEGLPPDLIPDVLPDMLVGWPIGADLAGASEAPFDIYDLSLF